VFGDNPDNCKSITVLPEQPIQFGYEGDADEMATKELVDRCARALECDVVLF
jgi:hypothetical protein